MAVRKMRAMYTVPWLLLKTSKIDFDMRVERMMASLRNSLLHEAGFPTDYRITYTSGLVTEEDEDGQEITMYKITAELRYVK